MYYNRDLSWLDFNFRVLQEANDERVPLFERLKFLAIFYSNLDEFFSVRYPVILAISRLKSKTRAQLSEDMTDDVLEKVQAAIEVHIVEAGNALEDKLIPALAQNNIILYYGGQQAQAHISEVRELFFAAVLSFIQPIFLDGKSINPFDPEANKLYLVVCLTEEGDNLVQYAVIRLPSDELQRFYTLSPIGGKDYVIFIEDIVKENIQFVFPGFSVVGVFNVTLSRDAALDYADDYSGDVVKKIERQLSKRAHGTPSRFLCEAGMPQNMRLYIASIFGVDHDELFDGGRYHHLQDLFSFPTFGKQLNYPVQKAIGWSSFIESGDIFRQIDTRDILLHFPYQSYNPILAFFNQAAVDPAVEEMYITLYRLAAGSLIANALISAAKNGKKVTVFIELKARFDEANNIHWSKRMKDAGVQILYSIPGIKVHTKIALVSKKVEGKRKSYALISTGNFNEHTAGLYTDHTLLTASKELTAELLTLFRFLEKRESPEKNMLSFKHLLVSQFNMEQVFKAHIAREILRVGEGGQGLIRIKMNNLEEPGMIDLLYEAAKAGVTVQLIIRSICCLIPGVEGLSEHITVKRLVGRFLEHTRLFIFGLGDEATVIIGSSDWMTRNLHRRVEACVPVTDTDNRKQLIDYFDLQWHDDDTMSGQAVDEHPQLAIYRYLTRLP
jgi:polyphosphate kinase